MWAILGCSFVVLTVFIERLVALRRDRVVPDVLLDALPAHLSAGDTARAEQLCREDKSVYSVVVGAALRARAGGRAASKEAMEETGRVELSQLEVRVGAISTVAAIAPLLGLLGTVTGMIKVFRDVAGVDNPDIALLANGIWEALITTGAGLTVAIPAYVMYRFIEGRIDRHTRVLEEAGLEALNALFPLGGGAPDPAASADAPNAEAPAADVRSSPEPAEG